MRKKNIKIFVFIYILAFKFNVLSQTDTSKFILIELIGDVTYYLDSNDSRGFYVSNIFFENDSIKSNLVGNCLENYSIIYKIDSLTKSVFETDTLSCIENTFAVRRTQNIGGRSKIHSPFYYQNLTNDSLQIIFQINARFYYNRNKNRLLLNKIHSINYSSEAYLERKKRIKSKVTETTFMLYE